MSDDREALIDVNKKLLEHVAYQYKLLGEDADELGCPMSHVVDQHGNRKILEIMKVKATCWNTLALLGVGK